MHILRTARLRILCADSLHRLCSFGLRDWEFCSQILYTDCAVLDCAIENSVHRFSTHTALFWTAPYRPAVKLKHSSTQRDLRALFLAANLPESESDHSLRHTTEVQYMCKRNYTLFTFLRLDYWTSNNFHYSEQIMFRAVYFFPSSSKMSEDNHQTSFRKSIFQGWRNYGKRHSLSSQYLYIFCPTNGSTVWRTRICINTHIYDCVETIWITVATQYI
jgi:hypothetical protein